MSDDITGPDGAGVRDMLGVPEYRRRLTDEALQAVENCVQGDSLLTAATVLMFEVRRLRRIVDENKTLTELRKDAERYRWLRAQHWSTGPLCVVADPKDAVQLGRCCPSGDYLDIAVDDAMLIGRAVGAA